jgi:hypothetical protein
MERDSSDQPKKNQGRKPYEKPTAMQLTPEEAKLKLIDLASRGSQDAKEMLEMMFPERPTNYRQVRRSLHKSGTQLCPPLKITEGESVIKIGIESCPHCRETEIYSSSVQSIWEDLIVLLLFRPVRCRGCEERFSRPLWVFTPTYPRRLKN